VTEVGMMVETILFVLLIEDSVIRVCTRVDSTLPVYSIVEMIIFHRHYLRSMW